MYKLTLLAGLGHLGLSWGTRMLSHVSSEPSSPWTTGNAHQDVSQTGSAPHLMEVLRLRLARSTKPKATGFQGPRNTNQLLPLFQPSLESDGYGCSERKRRLLT